MFKRSYNHKKRNNYNEILKFFPNIELSYEKTVHNKVQADIYLIIPKGRKCFLWFKNYNGKQYCFLLTINLKNKKITNISTQFTSFNNDLCSGKGTILYGTNFMINSTKCFNIENIFYYKGKNLTYYNQYDKLNFITNLTQNICQKKILDKQLIVGTPIISNNIDELYKKAINVPYNIYSIQHRLLFKNKTFLNLPYKSDEIIYKVFKIKATIVNDIYELYCRSKNEYEQIGKAYIPSYNTSVMMNNYFRNIKENYNLDALEESDDEDEFENTNIDKYVDLDKKISFKCVYNYKFNGWVPIEKSEEKISDKKEIILVEKKNKY